MAVYLNAATTVSDGSWVQVIPGQELKYEVIASGAAVVDFEHSPDQATISKRERVRLTGAGSQSRAQRADGNYVRARVVEMGSGVSATCQDIVGAGATAADGNAAIAQAALGTTQGLIDAAGNLDSLIVGPITRDSNGAATSAGVVWADGTTGTYTATTLSSAFPGAVDAYTVTYGSKTVTQPAVTRDSSTGAVTNRPAMTVA